MITTKVEIDVSTENSFSDEIFIDQNGKLDILVYGTFVATITLQRSTLTDVSGNKIWNDVVEYTEEQIDNTNESAVASTFRIGVKTGNFTSGTAKLILSRS